MMRIWPLFVAAIALLAGSALAQTASRPDAPSRQNVYVPPELEPWRDWVLHNHPHLGCPIVASGQQHASGESLCAWPGALQLDARATGADFEQRWQMYASGWVPLPGDGRYWPGELTLNGTPLAVLERNGAPFAWLAAGQHLLKGRIGWQQQPARLAIPSVTGLVNLSTNGRRVEFPRWTTGTLWLGRSTEARATSEDSLRITVHRLLTDDLPQRLETRIQLEVSGQARELLLARALPEGFVPMSVEGALPARIEPDGRLRLQLRPGSFLVRINARASALEQRIALAPAEGAWAEDEIWSYRSNDNLRVTFAEGDKPVDPTQTNVPGEWRGYAAFRLTPGDALRIVERSRGTADELDNRLNLNRQMWLDFSGDGFTVSDDIAGTLREGWRLDMEQPYRLMSARQNGRTLLVTAGAEAGHSGFEVRTRQLSVNAISQVDEAAASLPATGWQERFENVSGTVYLPPGYRLVAISGADQAPDAWLSQWRLLDYFLVLLTAVAAGKLLRPAFGAIALAVLVLTHGEYGAPVWSWLVLLAGVALVKYLPVGRLRSIVTVLRNLAFAALVLIVLPFAGNQLRLVVYPQLEADVQVGGFMANYASKASTAVHRERLTTQDMAAMPEAPQVLEEVVVSGARLAEPGAPPDRRSLYGIDALLQAGTPIPQWRARQHRFSISGPVLPEQTVRLWLLGPAIVGLLRTLAVALIALLLWRLATTSFGKLRLPRPPAVTVAVAATAVLTAAVISPAPVQAQGMPPAHLLQELEKRLTAPPACTPTCAEWSEARITVRPDGLAIEMVLDALDYVAAPLPGHLNGWLPQAVTLNGARVEQLLRLDNEVLYVPAPPGRHRLTLIGALPQRDAVSVPFPQPPHRVVVQAEGWEVAGVVEGRLVSGVLELVRAQAAAADAGIEFEPQQIPPFVSVVRNLEFDVEWEVTTRVSRLAPAQGAFTVRIPLIDGEALVSETLPVNDGMVTVGFAAGQRQVSWRSTLKKSDVISLTASAANEYAEVWSFTVSPLWRASFDGVPPAASEDAGIWQPVYYPRPGEQLRVALTQPEGLPGSTLAFDSVVLTTRQGQRNAESTLQLGYRSTRGGKHAIQLPPDARVLSVTADGAVMPLRAADDGTLTLPVVPGEHHWTITWQRGLNVGLRVATPSIDLGESAGNVQISLLLPADRWTVWTSGPQVGPAVLYWAELLVFLLAALVLSRTDLTPLRFHHWLVLGLGFSTYSWHVLVLVVAWLLALGLAARAPAPANRLLFNTRQVVLMLFSVITLATLVASISFALLGRPDLHVQGNGSSMSELRWFADQTQGVIPATSAFTLPLWLYKALILVWALWLSFALLRWLQWAWAAWSRDGLWRGRVATARTPPRNDAPSESSG